MGRKKKHADEKKLMEEKFEFGMIHIPRWKEYTLIKYIEKKEVSREKVWIDEAKLFPLYESS